MTEHVVTQYFTYWRGATFGTRDVIEGLVAEAHRAPSPQLEAALAQWSGIHYWENTPDGRWLVLVREAAAPRERWWLHAILLLLTLCTTSLAGATFAGAGSVVLDRVSLGSARAGLIFSLPLLAVLLAHESGHYVLARRYRVDTSPPFFVPFPPDYSVLGTMGAFIRLRSPILDRRTLFDIGVAGPIAGLIVAIPVLVIGLLMSGSVLTVAPHPCAHQLLVVAGEPYLLGDSLLMAVLRALVTPAGVVRLHPVAIAGWVGILVTMLNLLPLAQLDGGHVTYALFGPAQTWAARALWVLLLLLGFSWWGWWLWAGLALVLGRGRLRHPRVVVPERNVQGARRWIGYATIAIFLVCFMPVPITDPALERDVPSGVLLQVAHRLGQLPLQACELLHDGAVGKDAASGAARLRQ